MELKPSLTKELGTAVTPIESLIASGFPDN